MTPPRPFKAALTTLAAAATLTLVGCSMPNSSNPTLTLTNASVSNSAADVTVTVNNPSDYDLSLNAVRYQMVYGPLPVANGTWSFNPPVNIPSGDSHTFTKTVNFSGPVFEEADTLELTGNLDLDTPSAGADMAITEASFNTHASVK